MAINRRTLRLLRELSTTIGEEVDESTRRIVEAWVLAWDELSPVWRQAAADVVAQAVADGQWPAPWRMARMASLTSATMASGQALTALATFTGVTVAASTGSVVATTAAAEPALIASQLPPALATAAAAGYAANILPSALDLIVARTAEQVTALTRPLSDEATESVRRSLVLGIAVGDNPATVARDMVNRVEDAINGGLTRALTIARTEQLDAYRETSRYAHTANADVLQGWTWHCVCDPRSCPACWGMHGQLFAVDTPGPLGHQNCRCARLPKVKSWRELGFTDIEPDDEAPTGEALFAALSDVDQLAVMGRSRLAMLRSDDITWSDLAVRRDNRGWRPSYIPRPVRALRRIAGTRTP